MHRPRLQVLALAGVLMLAGYAASAGTHNTTQSETNPPFPPGVTEDGITNASRLVTAHFTAVNQTGYTDTTTVRYTGPRYRDGPLINRTETYRLTAAPGMAPLRYRTTTRTEFPERVTTSQRDVWSNESLYVTREPQVPSANGTQYCRWTTPFDPATATDLRHPFVGDLTAGNYTITDINRSGAQTRFTLRARNATQEATVSENLSSFNARLVVDSTGRIHSFKVAKTWTTETGYTARKRMRYRLVQTEVSTVAQPDWVTKALTRVPRPEEQTCSNFY